MCGRTIGGICPYYTSVQKMRVGYSIPIACAEKRYYVSPPVCPSITAVSIHVYLCMYVHVKKPWMRSFASRKPTRICFLLCLCSLCVSSSCFSWAAPPASVPSFISGTFYVRLSVFFSSFLLSPRLTLCSQEFHSEVLRFRFERKLHLLFSLSLLL